jgi:hypothetical protein
MQTTKMLNKFVDTHPKGSAFKKAYQAAVDEMGDRYFTQWQVIE